MKRFLLITLFILIFAPIAYAQNLPPDAISALGLLALILDGFGGTLASQVVDYLKSVKWLRLDELDQLAGIVMPFIVGVVSLVAAILFDRLLPLAGWLDQTGLYNVLIHFFGVYLMAEVRYRIKRVGK